MQEIKGGLACNCGEAMVYDMELGIYICLECGEVV